MSWRSPAPAPGWRWLPAQGRPEGHEGPQPGGGRGRLGQPGAGRGQSQDQRAGRHRSCPGPAGQGAAGRGRRTAGHLLPGRGSRLQVVSIGAQC